MPIHNRTPHAIRILPHGAPPDAEPVLVLPKPASRDDIARVEQTIDRTTYRIVYLDEAGEERHVEARSQTWGAVTGLPAPRRGDLHVVSAIVAAAAAVSGRGCRDLLVPGDLVRNAHGDIVGARGLSLASCAVPSLSRGAVVRVSYDVDDLVAMGVPRDAAEWAASKSWGHDPPASLGPSWTLPDELQGLYARLEDLCVLRGGHRSGSTEEGRPPGRGDLLSVCEALMLIPHPRPLACDQQGEVE